MGNGMNKILPGLYIGNFKDARDAEQLSRNKVTHILSVHDSARPMLEGVKYLCIPAADSPSQNLLAGVSRSVTLVVAYIMTVTDFGWEDALHTVRAGRSCANPNLGFQRQLQEFEKHQVHQFRQWLREEYGEDPLRDAEAARSILAFTAWGAAPRPPSASVQLRLSPPPAALAARASLQGLHAPRSWKKERFWAPSRFPLEYAFLKSLSTNQAPLCVLWI
ncbi:dual specificity protein phosphatase 22 isoform X2 [Vicugna pacos]|uniref:Dual specificity protein phosphatase 22 isoform X2 n=1 Tax=Vicugna pacos TaxID=30538 RepID=A0ABM5BZR9_VICPA